MVYPMKFNDLEQVKPAPDHAYPASSAAKPMSGAMVVSVVCARPLSSIDEGGCGGPSHHQLSPGTKVSFLNGKAPKYVTACATFVVVSRRNILTRTSFSFLFCCQISVRTYTQLRLTNCWPTACLTCFKLRKLIYCRRTKEEIAYLPASKFPQTYT